MIPHGLMTAYLNVREKRELEVRILDCSVLGFTFRLPKNMKLSNGSVRAACCLLMDGTTETAVMRSTDIELTGHTDWWDEYRLETQDSAYRDMTMRFMKQYARYAELKMQGDMRMIAREMCGAELPEEVYDSNIGELKKRWGADAVLPAQWKEASETAVVLGDPQTVKAYLDKPLDEFYSGYCAAHGFEDNPAAELKINCVYIGNQYCEHLIPKIETIRAVLRKAQLENISAVLALPPIREESMCRTEEMICSLAQKDGLREICVNDWGMLRFLQSAKLANISTVMGILLCKRRKDPRMHLLRDAEEFPDTTSTDDALYRQWINDHFGSVRFSYEAGTHARMDADAIVHWPMMQTNTAEYCTLRAALEYGDRAAQAACGSCPKYCTEHYFFYPKSLKMIGKYNSLFALRRGREESKFTRLVIDLP